MKVFFFDEAAEQAILPILALSTVKHLGNCIIFLFDDLLEHFDLFFLVDVFVLAIAFNCPSVFAFLSSRIVCCNTWILVRSSTIGTNAEAVPTFDVSAPFETGMFRASAGDVGHVKARPTDADKVDESTCRRDASDSF